MSFFETLAVETAGAQRALFAVPQIVDGLAGAISRETYLGYLAQAYQHVRHTVPLMRLAQGRLDSSRAHFRDALEAYIAEETGHEAWILDDIDHAGGDSEGAVAAGPSPATAAMVAYAYDRVGQGNPMALFGMIYVLEGTSIALASPGAEALAGALGLGPECFRYLSSHGALDQDHMAFFQRLMGEVDDPDDEAAIIDMAQRIFGLFGDMFRTIPHARSTAHAV